MLVLVSGFKFFFQPYSVFKKILTYFREKSYIRVKRFKLICDLSINSLNSMITRPSLQEFTTSELNIMLQCSTDNRNGKIIVSFLGLARVDQFTKYSVFLLSFMTLNFYNSSLLVDPQSRPTVATSSDRYFYTCQP